ncbi:MAG: hypothetical protein AcusKO_25340 [Acuticoccus sp.]
MTAGAAATSPAPAPAAAGSGALCPRRAEAAAPPCCGGLGAAAGTSISANRSMGISPNNAVTPHAAWKLAIASRALCDICP